MSKILLHEPPSPTFTTQVPDTHKESTSWKWKQSSYIVCHPSYINYK